MSTPTTDTGTIADPGPLGLAGFAMTTFVLSVFNANLITDQKLSAVVLPLALFYGGLAQLLAGMWEFRKGNTFGATAFGSFGAFWLAYAAYVKFVVPDLPASTAHQATGVFLLAWAIFTVYMTVAAMRTTGALLAVFVTLSATYIVLCIAEFAQSPNTTKAGGWLGLVTAVCAWYASFAGVTNSTYNRSVVPVFPNIGERLGMRRGHRGGPVAGVHA
ncbi:acetate uptake transporter [Streptomyces sp. KC 17012]|jgi:succinate-acetate transporter protein|uniref:acetate uptake transporter n=1 Tax=Streptomyces TaxID=1883 RepID=UPI001C9D9E01|nr:acetate uptake transporter [Streptomyces plumbidurans]MBY8342757.1 acetate uptake transporter [Streptomyces plumbidurans]